MPIHIEPLPSQELLLAKFTYNPENGIVYWKVRPPEDFTTYNAYRTWNSRFAKQPAGWQLKAGGGKVYICLTLDYKKFLAHRVIWKMVTGNDPVAEIDHDNGDSLNNKWSNLREADRNQQGQNKTIKSDNRTGYKNVQRLSTGKYRAYIKMDGKFKHLGVYNTAIEAHEVYCEVAKDLYGDFFNPG